MKKIKNRDTKKGNIERGGALILGLMIASILLSVGMGISNTALKEIRLSSIGNQSGIAFYMADTGAECALYWDSQSPAIIDAIDDGVASNDSALYVFATSTPTPPKKYVKGTSNIKCFGGSITDPSASWAILPGADANHATTEFTLLNPLDLTQPCVKVTVAKRDNGGGGTLTTIDSRGRNSCDPTDPRRVERGLKVSY